MQASRLQSIALAVFCIAAMGVTATTIESSLSTDPDDVINIDPAWLPIGGDSLIDAKDEMESNAEEKTSEEAESNAEEEPSGEHRSDGEPNSNEGGETNADSDGSASESGQPSDAPASASGDASAEETGGEVGQEFASAAEQVGTELEQGTTAEEGLLDRLLDLLRQGLLILLVLGALIVASVIGYRYADRFRGALSRDRDRQVALDWPPEEPADEVSRAWLAMVRRIDEDRPRSRTPEEWASAAVEAGMDPDAVDTITRTFAEVRYGDAPSTASRRQRAWANLERLRVGFDGGSR